jgi:hypothetical protein
LSDALDAVDPAEALDPEGIDALGGPASLLPPFIPLRPLARLATGLLLATLVAGWIAVGVDLYQLNLLFQASAGQDVEPIAREAWSLTDLVLFWVQAGLLALTAGAFLAWLYQARANLRAMGVRRLRFSREWAVGSFFVPVVNAFRPYQVMREVWQASDPGNLDPFAWRQLKVPLLLGIWWGAFVGWAALETMAVATSLGSVVTLPKLQLAAAFGLVADTFAALAAFLACFVVWRISDAQDEKSAVQAEA